MVKVLVGISKAKKASSSSSGVALQTRISPFICLSEFIQLLIGRVAPRLVTFSHEELNMLFSGQIPSALLQLQGVVDGVKECGSVFKVRREGSTSLCPSEYGLYFQDAQGRDAFWFGVWTLFWTEHRFPLCFGVAERWGPEVMEAIQARIHRWLDRSADNGWRKCCQCRLVGVGACDRGDGRCRFREGFSVGFGRIGWHWSLQGSGDLRSGLDDETSKADFKMESVNSLRASIIRFPLMSRACESPLEVPLIPANRGRVFRSFSNFVS